ncbi:MAG TPA: hypothetical protein VLT82_18060 [Myxococcaceae bacterium]|nr:hypothetical protein [Myxococcaceae bacterium]
MNPPRHAAGLVLTLLIAPLALAQDHAPPSPPQEAVDACTGRETGAACSFQHDGHAVSGTCHPAPDGTVSACAPVHVFQGPPPEALQACQGQQDGASCRFTGPGGEEIAGLCRSGPHGEPPACAPRNARRPPAARQNDG